MTANELEIRKKVKATPMGEVGMIDLGGMDYEQARLCALRYSRLKKLPITVLGSAPDVLKFKRVTADEARTVTYPEMDLLKIGDSHLFELPRPLQQRVRMAASVRNRRGTVLLSCSVEASGIRVTRYPLTQTEIDAHGPIQEPQRASKYGLERLAAERELRFTPADHAELMRIRSSVSVKGKLTGWKLACRTQFDGSVTVTRLDLPAPGAQP